MCEHPLTAPSGVCRNVTDHPTAAAAPATPPPIRLAIYNGGGTFGGGWPHEHEYYVTLRAAASALGQRTHRAVTITNLTAPTVPTHLTTDSFDAVLFPGGSGSGQARALGAAGMGAVRAFVAGGGGYVGTCGGAFLALEHLMLYGTPPLPTVEPWKRGHGPVQVEFTAAAAATLHLDPQTYANKNVTIEYWQGPIVRPTDLPPSVTVLASYRTEIHSLSPNTTTGTMVNTPAMTSASYGKGRVFLNSPHPEIPSETPAEGTSAEGTHGGTYHKTRPEIYEGELAWVIRMDA